MKLLNQFLKETRNGGVLATENAFVTYSQPDTEHIYIEDIYVIPRLREYRLASKLADMVCAIGKVRKCKYVMGSIDKGSKTKEKDIAVLEAYGLKEWKEDDYFIYYRKQLNG